MASRADAATAGTGVDYAPVRSGSLTRSHKGATRMRGPSGQPQRAGCGRMRGCVEPASAPPRGVRIAAMKAGPWNTCFGIAPNGSLIVCRVGGTGEAHECREPGIDVARPCGCVASPPTRSRPGIHLSPCMRLFGPPTRNSWSRACEAPCGPTAGASSGGRQEAQMRMGRMRPKGQSGLRTPAGAAADGRSGRAICRAMGPEACCGRY